MKKRHMITFMFLFVIAVSLQVLKIYLTNELIDHGMSREALLKEVDEYRKENDILREQILYYSSLRYIDQKARSEGFRETRDEDYIYL